MQTMRCKDGYPTMSIHHDPWIQMECKMHGETTNSAQQQEGSHGNTSIKRRLRAKEEPPKIPIEYHRKDTNWRCTTKDTNWRITTGSQKPKQVTNHSSVLNHQLKRWRQEQSTTRISAHLQEVFPRTQSSPTDAVRCGVNLSPQGPVQRGKPRKKANTSQDNLETKNLLNEAELPLN